MASPAVTYTFTNGTTADATQVNQNFTDIINGMTDGTKDLSISALTCAGSAILNGNVTLGNASGDDITVNGSIASHVVSKTTATYNLGSSSIGYLGVYQSAGASYTFSWLGSASASASYTLTVPTATGVVGQGMVVSASGVLSWKPQQMDTAAKVAAYVITDTDGLRTVLVTTGGTGRDVTLPTASANTHRIITVKKMDSAADLTDIITLKSDAEEETIDGIDGTVGVPIGSQYSWVTAQCDGSDWHIIGRDDRWPSYEAGVDSGLDLTGGGDGSTPNDHVTYSRFIPYQTAEGDWRLKIQFAISSFDGSATTHDIAISNITRADDGSVPSGEISSTTVYMTRVSWQTTSSLRLASNGAYTAGVWVNGDVGISARPSWATRR